MNTAQVNERPDAYKDRLEWFKQLGEQGAKVLGCVSGRTTGVLMSLEGTVNPFVDRETYMKLAKLPLDQRFAELSKPDVKAQILSEKGTRKGEFWEQMQSDA